MVQYPAMKRQVIITDTHTVFMESGGPWVRIDTNSWIGQPYSDILHAVQSQIEHWMTGENDHNYLVLRLEYHSIKYKVIS